MKKRESKALIRKANKALDALNKIRFCAGTYDLQLEKQESEIKKELYDSIDCLKRFIDNIK